MEFPLAEIFFHTLGERIVDKGWPHRKMNGWMFHLKIHPKMEKENQFITKLSHGLWVQKVETFFQGCSIKNAAGKMKVYRWRLPDPHQNMWIFPGFFFVSPANLSQVSSAQLRGQVHRAQRAVQKALNVKKAQLKRWLGRRCFFFPRCLVKTLVNTGVIELFTYLEDQVMQIYGNFERLPL